MADSVLGVPIPSPPAGQAAGRRRDRGEAAGGALRAGAGGVQERDPADRQAAAHQPGPTHRLLRPG